MDLFISSIYMHDHSLNGDCIVVFSLPFVHFPVLHHSPFLYRVLTAFLQRALFLPTAALVLSCVTLSTTTFLYFLHLIFTSFFLSWMILLSSIFLLRADCLLSFLLQLFLSRRTYTFLHLMRFSRPCVLRILFFLPLSVQYEL